MPRLVAAFRVSGGTTLDMLKRVFANSFGRLAASAGYSILDVRCEEMWQLNNSTLPSDERRSVIDLASVVGSPSVDSPSVMCKTTGGYPFGCSLNHCSMIFFVCFKAAHIGVPSSARGSSQIGNLTV